MEYYAVVIVKNLVCFYYHCYLMLDLFQEIPAESEYGYELVELNQLAFLAGQIDAEAVTLAFYWLWTNHQRWEHQAVRL